MLIIHINRADLPSNNEHCEQHKVRLELTCFRFLSVQSKRLCNQAQMAVRTGTVVPFHLSDVQH